jgi:hypothetical protein
MIQDFFMVATPKPSNIYAIDGEIPACLLVVSPLTVGGNVNPKRKKETEM